MRLVLVDRGRIELVFVGENNHVVVKVETIHFSLVIGHVVGCPNHNTLALCSSPLYFPMNAPIFRSWSKTYYPDGKHGISCRAQPGNRQRSMTMRLCMPSFLHSSQVSLSE